MCTWNTRIFEECFKRLEFKWHVWGVSALFWVCFVLFSFCCREKNNLTCLNASVSHFSPEYVIRSQQQNLICSIDRLKEKLHARRDATMLRGCYRNLFSAEVFLDIATQLNRDRLESNLVLTLIAELRTNSPQIPSPYSEHTGMALHVFCIPWDASKSSLLFWVKKQLAWQEVGLLQKQGMS